MIQKSTVLPLVVAIDQTICDVTDQTEYEYGVCYLSPGISTGFNGFLVLD